MSDPQTSGRTGQVASPHHNRQQATRRFALQEAWGQLPAGFDLGQVAVATDSADRVYLFNRSDPTMIVLTSAGEVIDFWSDPRMRSAHGIYIDHSDNVFLPVRDASVVLKYSGDWTLEMTLGRWGEHSDTGHSGDYRTTPLRAAGPFNRPTDVAVAPDGEIYVSDGYGNARIHRFGADGRLIQSWGSPGKTGLGEFHVPHAVWIHADGRVVVADRENNRIQVFTRDGHPLDEWTGLRRPADVFIDPAGIVYVAELDGLVAMFDLDGTLLSRWGSPTGSGPLSGGHSIWADSRGDIYVGQNQPDARLLKYARLDAPRSTDAHTLIPSERY